jgi:serine/threonine protein phosphatase 1
LTPEFYANSATSSSGEILDLGFLLWLDANGARGGWLTALEVETGQVWQADCAGRLPDDRRDAEAGR